MRLREPGAESPSGTATSACWWWRDADTSRPSAPALTGDARADVVIVGGGFTGLWTALAIRERQPESDVVLLEARTCGSGASGRNGGAVSGYWHAYAKLSRLVGPSAASELGHLGDEAQEAVLALCRARRVAHAEHPMLTVATSPAQVAAVAALVAGNDAVPEDRRPQRATASALHDITGNRRLRFGAWLPAAATVHPAQLCLALRGAALDAGVRIHEDSPVAWIDPRSPEVRTRSGATIRAGAVVLAANAWQSALPRVRRMTTNMSSHVLVTEPVPDLLTDLDWPPPLFLRDARSFLHWIRRTADDRLIVGTGAGPLSARGRVSRAQEHPSPGRLEHALARFLPQAADVRVEARWGGAIDLSADTVPYVGTYPGTQVSFVTGLSGHGVNASWIVGQALASRALGQADRWSDSVLCSRRVPRLPPEPFRSIGGFPIHHSSIRYEDQLDANGHPSFRSRAVSSVSDRLGIRLGVR